MLGDLIFRLREREQRSQWDLARALRWPQSKLSRFETGKQVPKADDLETLLVELHATDEDRLDACRSLRPPPP